MSPPTAPAPLSIAPARVECERDQGWLRAARQAKLLAWASLFWMTLEGALGLLAGIEANSISVLTWAASSAVEGLASAIVIWRFSGRRKLSEDSERRAQRWVAASFFLLAPYFLYESVDRLINGTHANATPLAIALTASSLVLMPLLGFAKLQLGRRLDSGATAGEGVQNLLCAAQALAALIAVAAAADVAFIDPLAALLIAGIATKEGVELWRGEECDCHSIPGFDTAHDDRCADDCCGG
ncbi:MAG TPA: cation transporter [Solirubrobacteraceae bacterium]|nr:cation transporter [Solirubrobacteraceae bacterium]